MADVVLFEDATIKVKVEEIWSEVIRNSNAVISQTEKYGFSLIAVVPNPNIHQMLITLRAIEGLLDVIIDSVLFDGMEHDETRLVLNARENIRKMEYVAIALKENDEEAYIQAVKGLEMMVSF